MPEDVWELIVDTQFSGAQAVRYLAGVGRWFRARAHAHPDWQLPCHAAPPGCPSARQVLSDRVEAWGGWRQTRGLRGRWVSTCVVSHSLAASLYQVPAGLWFRCVECGLWAHAEEPWDDGWWVEGWDWRNGCPFAGPDPDEPGDEGLELQAEHRRPVLFTWALAHDAWEWMVHTPEGSEAHAVCARIWDACPGDVCRECYAACPDPMRA